MNIEDTNVILNCMLSPTNLDSDGITSLTFREWTGPDGALTEDIVNRLVYATQKITELNMVSVDSNEGTLNSIIGLTTQIIEQTSVLFTTQFDASGLSD